MSYDFMTDLLFQLWRLADFYRRAQRRRPIWLILATKWIINWLSHCDSDNTYYVSRIDEDNS